MSPYTLHSTVLKMNLRTFAIVSSGLVLAAAVACCSGRVEETAGGGARGDADVDSQRTDADSQQTDAVASETSSPRSPCSTGAPYETTANFPFVDVDGGATEPTCIPRCGAVRGSPDPVFGIDALPSGTCEVEGEVCKLGAREKCPPPNTRGPLTVFRCSCVNGAWTCGVLFRGASGCAGARDE